jgi:hypothetical protein
MVMAEKNMSFDDVVSKSETWSGDTISNQRLGEVRQYQIKTPRLILVPSY